MVILFKGRMPINADKPHLWKSDVSASVDLFNKWFMLFAPKAYRDTRIETTKDVAEGLRLTKDLTAITPAVLKKSPAILPTLRMCDYSLFVGQTFQRVGPDPALA